MRVWLRLFFVQLMKRERYPLRERLALAKRMADAAAMIAKGPPYRRLWSMALALAIFVAPAAAQGPAQVIVAIPVVWDSNTTVANATIPIVNPAWAGGGTIVSVTYYTNGTGTPSFTANVKIGGTSVTGCSALSVSSASPTTTACTAANTFTSSSQITLVISAVSGTPNQALVQINMTTTLN